MKSWFLKESKEKDTPKKIVDFFNEIEEISKKYGLSISHEDGHGSFIIEKYNESNIEWFKDAAIDLG